MNKLLVLGPGAVGTVMKKLLVLGLAPSAPG